MGRNLVRTLIPQDETALDLAWWAEFAARRNPEAGIRARCLRRIEQERTWVVVEDDRLTFKADVISETSSVVYLEGIWVRDERRSNGNGVRFMSELTHKLLEGTKSICLLVNETNQRAQNFYRKCGFRFRATYETIFLPRKEFLRN